MTLQRVVCARCLAWLGCPAAWVVARRDCTLGRACSHAAVAGPEPRIPAGGALHSTPLHCGRAAPRYDPAHVRAFGPQSRAHVRAFGPQSRRMVHRVNHRHGCGHGKGWWWLLLRCVLCDRPICLNLEPVCLEPEQSVGVGQLPGCGACMAMGVRVQQVKQCLNV